MLDIPDLPGLYIVTVDCDEPISVNASDARIVDKCITITPPQLQGRTREEPARTLQELSEDLLAAHCHLPGRRLLDEVNAAESACAARLKSWRMRGRTGRLNEWLVNIEPEHVKEIVIDTLTNSQFVHVLAPDEHH